MKNYSTGYFRRLETAESMKTHDVQVNDSEDNQVGVSDELFNFICYKETCFLDVLLFIATQKEEWQTLKTVTFTIDGYTEDPIEILCNNKTGPSAVRPEDGLVDNSCASRTAISLKQLMRLADAETIQIKIEWGRGYDIYDFDAFKYAARQFYNNAIEDNTYDNVSIEECNEIEMLPKNESISVSNWLNGTGTEKTDEALLDDNGEAIEAPSKTRKIIAWTVGLVIGVPVAFYITAFLSLIFELERSTSNMMFLTITGFIVYWVLRLFKIRVNW